MQEKLVFLLFLAFSYEYTFLFCYNGRRPFERENFEGVLCDSVIIVMENSVFFWPSQLLWILFLFRHINDVMPSFIVYI